MEDHITLRKYVRSIIIEIGRNIHSVHTSPISYKDFQDYDIEIYPTGDSNFIVSISFRGDLISTASNFKYQEEADQFARSVVDTHRVKFMNSQ